MAEAQLCQSSLLTSLKASEKDSEEEKSSHEVIRTTAIGSQSGEAVGECRVSSWDPQQGLLSEPPGGW